MSLIYFCLQKKKKTSSPLRIRNNIELAFPQFFTVGNQANHLDRSPSSPLPPLSLFFSLLEAPSTACFRCVCVCTVDVTPHHLFSRDLSDAVPSFCFCCFARPPSPLFSKQTEFFDQRMMLCVRLRYSCNNVVWRHYLKHIMPKHS